MHELLVCSTCYSNNQTLPHFENGHDVSPYFMLGRTETGCIMFARKYARNFKKKKARLKCWCACRDTLRCHIHPQSGILFILCNKPIRKTYVSKAKVIMLRGLNPMLKILLFGARIIHTSQHGKYTVLCKTSITQL